MAQERQCPGSARLAVERQLAGDAGRGSGPSPRAHVQLVIAANPPALLDEPLVRLRAGLRVAAAPCRPWLR